MILLSPVEWKADQPMTIGHYPWFGYRSFSLHFFFVFFIFCFLFFVFVVYLYRPSVALNICPETPKVFHNIIAPCHIAESDVNRKSYFMKNVALTPYGFIYSLLCGGFGFTDESYVKIQFNIERRMVSLAMV